MALKFVEILEHFSIDPFWIKIIQFEKTGLKKNKIFISPKFENQIPLSKLKVNDVFRDFNNFTVR